MDKRKYKKYGKYTNKGIRCKNIDGKQNKKNN